MKREKLLELVDRAWKNGLPEEHIGEFLMLENVTDLADGAKFRRWLKEKKERT